MGARCCQWKSIRNARNFQLVLLANGKISFSSFDIIYIIRNDIEIFIEMIQQIQIELIVIIAAQNARGRCYTHFGIFHKKKI